MSDLVIEVDEAMKQERIEKLWQKYGGFFIGCLAVIILGTAANEGYKSWKHHQDVQQTNLYLDALSKKETSPDDILAVIPKLENSLKGMAELHAAGIAIDKGDIAAALDIYRSVEGNDQIDPMSKYIARYMVTNLDQDLSTDHKRTRYQSLSSDENNPWRFHAYFALALLEAHEGHDYNAARQSLAAILNESVVAETLKQKAKSLDILYAAKDGLSK
tara:strand:- start:18328 stop:18978 length:651 start_codon:yes stop_codon:yes gene_type:complete